MRLGKTDFRVLAQLKLHPYGQEFIELLRRELNNADIMTRTATADLVGRRQGEALLLAELIDSFDRAEELGR